MNILFLCTGNSCRSIIAEAVFNHLAPEGWNAASAGSSPTGEVHPRSLELLKRRGISTEGLSSKSWASFEGSPPDIVITVCASAAGESCPVYLGNAIRAHWGTDDPAKATGSTEEVGRVFELTYQSLRSRIERFLKLPLESLSHDTVLLGTELRRIGNDDNLGQKGVMI